MITLLPRLAGDAAGLVSIDRGNGSACLQFWRSVFERRAPHFIPAAEAAAKTEIRQGNTTRDVTGHCSMLSRRPTGKLPP